jgi:hypothetical protein
MKRYKSPNTDQILTKLIQAGGNILCSEIHKLINSVWNKEELPQKCNESIIVPIHKKVDKTDSSNYNGISLFPITYRTLPNILLSVLAALVDEVLGISVDFYVVNQLLTRYYSLVRYR